MLLRLRQSQGLPLVSTSHLYLISTAPGTPLCFVVLCGVRKGKGVYSVSHHTTTPPNEMLGEVARFREAPTARTWVGAARYNRRHLQLDVHRVLTQRRHSNQRLRPYLRNLDVGCKMLMSTRAQVAGDNFASTTSPFATTRVNRPRPSCPMPSERKRSHCSNQRPVAASSELACLPGSPGMCRGQHRLHNRASPCDADLKPPRPILRTDTVHHHAKHQAGAPS